jgi:hypothetical protein
MAPDEEQKTEEEKIVHEVTSALNDLPILARLEFAKNLLMGNGGDRHSLPQLPGLVIAHEVVTDVIRVLEKHTAAAQLRTPKL